MNRFNLSGHLALAMGWLLIFGVAVPTHAQTSDDIVRTIVEVADVIFRDGHPYYRYNNERLIVGRDRYGRPVYYRNPETPYYRGAGYYGAHPYRHGYERNSTIRCNHRGWCTKSYYDPNHDRRRHRYNYYPQ